MEELKKAAAEKVLGFVKDNMVLGLGTGSTVAYFLDLLAEKIRNGLLKNIKGIPTSENTRAKALELGISLTTLDQISELDLAVDGADEVDPNFNLIKGLGKALFREKVVEIHAKKFIVIVDESKLVPKLGSRGPLPVEILPFGALAHVRWLETLGCKAELWLEDGKPVISDNGNYLVRCSFTNSIENPLLLAQQLEKRPGIIEHGLFIDMADVVVVAKKDRVEILDKG